ncbi:MAG: hypothetical protein JWO82_1721, partial [Akkermansiaceae bacterium]|nr:hypothetical protein [Akkermansiaceae bacterium]
MRALFPAFALVAAAIPAAHAQDADALIKNVRLSAA